MSDEKGLSETAAEAPPEASRVVIVPFAELAERSAAALREAGADEPSVEATTRAVMHASLLGIDSHGVRLIPHYCKVLRGGRVNGRPKLAVTRTAPAAAMIDADDALGHLPSYRAVELAAEIAAETGIAAVGVRRSSHYGAAGAYALAGAELGFFTFSTTNADSLVALFGSAGPFHGTNPLAFAAPVAEGRPWLFDMATSSVPLNRVYLYRILDKGLPDDVAADEHGQPVTDPHAVRMLLPLGAAFGFKGAGLAGVATILAAAITGGALDHEMLSMTRGEDLSTPRNLGHFFFAIDPERFAGREAYNAAMRSYLTALRAVPPAGDDPVMAPGDREWKVADIRLRDGIPVDVETAEFLGLRR
jgi:LDH2 family malate/lactate/ureidoglycolate dehydrogenase